MPYSSPSRSAPVRYVAASALVCLFLVAQAVIGKSLPGEPAADLYVIPIAAAAFFGGVGAGVFATILAVVGEAYLLMEPRFSWAASDPADRVELAMMVFLGLAATALVTGLQQARRAGERERIQQSVTLASIGEAIVTCDLEGRITFMNAEAEQLTGWSLSQSRGASLEALLPLVHVDSDEPIHWPHLTAMKTGMRTTVVRGALMKRRDGGLVPIADSCAPLREDKGPVLGAVVIFRDATTELEAASAIEERRGLQQMLERLAATAPGVLYAFRHSADGTARFPYCSPGISELFTADPADLAQDAAKAFATIHPEDLPRVLSTTELSAASLMPWMEQFRIKHPLRGEIWLEGHSMPTREPDGGTLWYGFLNDITARKQGEATLRENELRLSAIIGSAMDGIISVDQDQRITLFNPAAERMFGCTAEAAIGEPLDRFMPARYRRVHQEHVSRFGKTGNTRRHTGMLESVNGLRADGSEFPIEASISHITVGGQAVFTVILRDVEARTRAEAAIKQSEARFRQLAGSIHEVFWMTNPETHTVEYISPAYEDIWGRSCASLYASPMDWVDAIHPEDRERVAAAFLSTGTVGTYEEEFRIFRPDGSIRWIRDRGFPVLNDEGTVVGIAGVAEDVTTRRMLEVQIRSTQKMESVGLLAGGVAHDFNNFLTVISGESELLLDQMPADDPGRSAVQGIHDAGLRAAMLTRQLLAFSRQQVLAPKVLDLNQVVGDTERMLHRLLGEDILLESRLDPSIGQIKVDPGHLVQVLLNLAVNARDAMPRGGRLTLTTGEAMRAPDPAHPAVRQRYVTLRIADNGTGMAPDVLARLFEPFFTTKGVGKGTGLGLSVVHGIVSQSGGTIDVQSALGSGTTFSIYFPVVPATEVATVNEAARMPVRKLGTEQVLVVEDEEAVRRLAVRTLRAAGYQVREAADGLKALELLNQPGQPGVDLLVTDLVMPNLSGRELAEELTARQPGLRVLYSSGYTDDAVIRHGIQAAEVSFLQKPYTPNELSQKVREVLDH